MLRLDQLEALYYELQLQLYDIQAEVLRCEELLLTAQLKSLRRQMTGEPVVCFCIAQCDRLHKMSYKEQRCIVTPLATSSFPAAVSGCCCFLFIDANFK